MDTLWVSRCCAPRSSSNYISRRDLRITNFKVLFKSSQNLVKAIYYIYIYSQIPIRQPTDTAKCREAWVPWYVHCLIRAADVVIETFHIFCIIPCNNFETNALNDLKWCWQFQSQRCQIFVFWADKCNSVWWDFFNLCAILASAWIDHS